MFIGNVTPFGVIHFYAIAYFVLDPLEHGDPVDLIRPIAIASKTVVVCVWARPIASFFAVTVAPPTTAPVGSVTVPVIRDVPT